VSAALPALDPLRLGLIALLAGDFGEHVGDLIGLTVKVGQLDGLAGDTINTKISARLRFAAGTEYFVHC
jgi:hypothetical protein